VGEFFYNVFGLVKRLHSILFLICLLQSQEERHEHGKYRRFGGTVDMRENPRL
jgi:hypothetical protein